MNTKVCLAFASVGALVVGVASIGSMGCGSSSSGSGGTTGTTTATTTTSTATTGTNTGTSTSTGMSACEMMCQTMHAAGYQKLLAAVTQSCGCMAGSTCNTQCKTEMACTAGMGVPVAGGACDTCIQAEGAKGQSSQCAVNAAFGMTCQDDTECKALVTCDATCAGG